jgi:DNA invertase Pin-like site-specific DNA recombinase
MPQDTNPAHSEQALTELRRKATQYRAARTPEARAAARTALHGAIATAVRSGARQARAAEASGLSKAQVSRIARGGSSGNTSLPKAVPMVDSIPAEDVIARYRAGESTNQIGKTYGCSGFTITSILKRNGVSRRAGRTIELPVSNEELARRYLLDRAEIQQLAAELGVKPDLISRRLAAAGVVVPLGSRRMDLPDAEIVERYKRGEPVQQIAKAYGVSWAPIMQRIREGGDLVLRRPVPTEQKKQAVRLYQTGLSPNAVASQLGLSRTTVRNAVVEAGVKRPSPQTLVLEGLQSDTMREIQERHRSGASVNSLAREYGIPRTTLQRRIERLQRRIDPEEESDGM